MYERWEYGDGNAFLKPRLLQLFLGPTKNRLKTVEASNTKLPGKSALASITRAVRCRLKRKDLSSNSSHGTSHSSSLLTQLLQVLRAVYGYHSAKRILQMTYPLYPWTIHAYAYTSYAVSVAFASTTSFTCGSIPRLRWSWPSGVEQKLRFIFYGSYQWN